MFCDIFFSLFLIIYLNYNLVYCVSLSLQKRIYSLSSWGKAYCPLFFNFAHFGIFPQNCAPLSRVSLWVFSAGVWPQNKPEKQKADVSLVKNRGDHKPTICAKVGVKFYDNLKIKVEDLGEGKWESEGQSAEGCMKLQLGTRVHMATPRASAGPVRVKVSRHRREWLQTANTSQRAAPAMNDTSMWELWGPGTVSVRETHSLSPRTESNPQRGEQEKSPELSGETKSKPTSGKMKCFLSSAVTVMVYEQVFRYRKIEKIKFLSM